MVGLFLYSAWLRSRNLREFPHNKPCHDCEAPEAPIFPRGGVAGRSTDYRPPAPSPRALLPDRNITALRGSKARARQLRGSSCSAIRAGCRTFRLAADLRTLPGPSDFSRGGGSAPLKREPPRSSLPQGKGARERRSSQAALHADRPLLTGGRERHGDSPLRGLSKQRQERRAGSVTDRLTSTTATTQE